VPSTVQLCTWPTEQKANAADSCYFLKAQSIVIAVAYSTRYYSQQNIQLTQLTDKKLCVQYLGLSLTNKPEI